jgi:hypothetical protein
VFLHNRPGAVFHPKFCWFHTGTGGNLVTGSGNLTAGACGITGKHSRSRRLTVERQPRSRLIGPIGKSVIGTDYVLSMIVRSWSAPERTCGRLKVARVVAQAQEIPATG